MQKVGRKNSIDLKKKGVKEKVAIFGKLLATHEEMADYFDCSVRTIERYMRTETDEDGNETTTEFCRVYKTAASNAKVSLRRKQMQKANQGDNTMLIWLGKQLLGQKDQTDVTSKGQKINDSKNIDLAGISTNDLRSLLAIAEKHSKDSTES